MKSSAGAQDNPYKTNHGPLMRKLLNGGFEIKEEDEVLLSKNKPLFNIADVS